MDYIKRAIEDIVLHSDKTFKSILITGARQTGKTKMIKELFPDKKYVLIDDPFIEEQATSNPNMFMMLNPPPVIYDEVQRAPELFRYIKIACDASDDNAQFCLSGSQPLELMEKASESLAGRVGIIELSPLSQREIDRDPFNLPFVPTIEYIKERNQSSIVIAVKRIKAFSRDTRAYPHVFNASARRVQYGEGCRSKRFERNSIRCECQ